MKQILFSLLFTCLFSKTFAQFPLTDHRDSASYAIGLDIASNFMQLGATIDQINLDAIMAGMEAKLSPDGTPLFDANQSRALSTGFFKALQQAKMAAIAEKNKTFLAENGQKEGVVTLPSGLQYKVIAAGPAEGPNPQKTNQVTVHYEGRLTNGEVFDSSYQRGEPETFGVGQVIKGWTEGLQLMKPGDKFQMYIPPELGYGPRGAPPKIGPNEILVFEVELISIQ